MNFIEIICMSAIKGQPSKVNNASNKKSLITVGGIIAIVAVLLFAYLMWYVTPDEYTERVEVIAVTQAGCIAETYDGFAVNIGNCKVETGEYVNALIDSKVKERASLMNPTS